MRFASVVDTTIPIDPTRPAVLRIHGQLGTWQTVLGLRMTT
jgi:hypothetical protein